MKKGKGILGILMLVLLLGWGTSNAAVYTFGDDATYWPGWGYAGDDDNTRDVIGSPDLTGGEVIINDQGLLEKITFNYDTVGSEYSAGDLFIDVDADQIWDYVVHNEYEYADPDTHWHGILSSTLYEVNIALNSQDAYYLSDYTWGGPSYRNSHPTVLKDLTGASYIGNVNVTDFNNSQAPGTVIFDFTNITSGTNFDWSQATIGFTTTCANDVIYETVNGGSHTQVPEPATVMIVGLGLLGLGICSSKRMKKKN